jgi:hypothetical protein
VFRGALLALTSTTLAVAAHVLAGGMVPGIGLISLLTMVVAAGGIAVADRCRGTLGVLAALGAAELGMHLILSVASDGSAMPMPRIAVADGGWPMTGAHVLAVLLTAPLLARAGAALLLVAGLFVRLVPRVLAGPPVPAAVVRSVVRPATADRRLAVLLCRRHPRRGPPLAA